MEGRRREEEQGDVRLVFADRGWLRSDQGADLIAALESHPSIDEVQRRKSTIYVRFRDDALVDLERRLAAWEPAGMDAGEMFAGQPVTISFLGPNTNKALHVGHLRNVVLGEALSSAGAAAGTVVRRHNLVGDIGRRVGEAMAGYESFYRDKLPADEGLSGDRFVELCTGEYTRQQTRSSPDQEEADPNAEERKATGDLADQVMVRWLQGSSREQALWGQMREWVLDGHRQTLARLGVVMDHQDFESEDMPRATALIEEGLASGILEREPTGAVLYRTDRSEYPVMVLIREDGFPTEHARLLGVYDHILEGLAPDESYIELAGLEWQLSITVLNELLERLRPGPRNERDVRVFHGSVTSADGRKIGSSVGGVVWIDDFLDRVAAGAAVSRLRDLSEDTVGREELADILIRAPLLCTPIFRSVAFDQEELVEGGSGPGSTIAEAWCRAQLSKQANESSGPATRTGVIQSQFYRRALREAVEKRDVSGLARYLLYLSEAFLAAPEPGPAAAPALARVLNSLGFLAGRASAETAEHSARLTSSEKAAA